MSTYIKMFDSGPKKSKLFSIFKYNKKNLYFCILLKNTSLILEVEILFILIIKNTVMHLT